jgi:3-oxoacyl-[acyl-carrier protein] reductase
MTMKKAALVTGGSRGLGREIALALGEAGFGVAVNYLKNGAQAGEVAAAMEDAIAVRADMRNPSEVAEMARAVEKRWGRLDALINNAGITKDALLIKLSGDDWDEVMDTNLNGCFNALKTFVPLLLKSGGGHIVNISSRSGLRGKAGQAAYSSSKAALIGLTRTLAAELGVHNIRVNAVLPGYMPTGMGKDAKAAIERAQRESLLGRLSDPKEAAAFVAWLLRTEGITGQVFTLDSRGDTVPPFPPTLTRLK